MSGPGRSVDALKAGRSLRTARTMTITVILMAAASAAAGLLLPNLYRDTAWVVPQNRGTDFVTLTIALPCLALSLRAALRGSARAVLIWFGLMGYICYVYTGASFAYAFNELFLVYVALFSCSIAGIVALGLSVDAAAVSARFDSGTPRRAVIAFLWFLAVMLAILWMSQIVPFLLRGVIPEGITRSGAPTMFVYVLDLGVVVPLSLLAATWLRRGRPWGALVAGLVLVKAATMGLALLAMTAFAVHADQSADSGLAVAWVAIAVLSLGISVWYFRHCRP